MARGGHDVTHASYRFTAGGPLTASGFALVAVEGISGAADGTFQLDYDP